MVVYHIGIWELFQCIFDSLEILNYPLQWRSCLFIEKVCSDFASTNQSGKCLKASLFFLTS